jgi:hypothetical protein
VTNLRVVWLVSSVGILRITGKSSSSNAFKCGLKNRIPGVTGGRVDLKSDVDEVVTSGELAIAATTADPNRSLLLDMCLSQKTKIRLCSVFGFSNIDYQCVNVVYFML